MAESLSQGFAQGLLSGAELALRKNEQEFSQRMQRRRQEAEEAAAWAADGEREKGQNPPKDEPRKMAGPRAPSTPERTDGEAGTTWELPNEWSGHRPRDPLLFDSQDDSSQRMAAWPSGQSPNEEENELYRRVGGASLRRFAGTADRAVDDLRFGRRSVDELSPKEFTHLVAYKTGFLPSDLLDTDEGPGRVGQALRRVRGGIRSLPRDGGYELLGGFNDLAGHELHGLIGQLGHDGQSRIVSAEFAAPVAHPDSPRHLMLTAKLGLQHPDGRMTQQYVPVLDDHGQMVAHPDAAAAAAVRNFDVRNLFNHIGALQTLHQAINTHPSLRAKAVDGYLGGYEDEAREKLDLMRRLGRNPAGWLPSSAPAGGEDRGVASADQDWLEGPAHPVGIIVQDRYGMRLRSLGQGRWQEMPPDGGMND